MGKRGLGKKTKAINQEQVEQLFAIQCTQKEVLGVLGVCKRTFQQWVERETDYANSEEMQQMCSERGKSSLRRTLFKTAQKDPGTLRFLAKNHLGMADKIEQNTSGTLTINMDSSVANNVT